MIQRIQSIFYLLAAICASVVFFLPFATSQKEGSPFMEDKMYTVQDHTLLLVVSILAIALPLIAIFLFKNRPFQMRIGYLSIVFSILIIAAAAILFFKGGSEMLESLSIDDGLGIYFPIGAVVFAALANRYVKKDDDLVTSSDRLR